MVTQNNNKKRGHSQIEYNSNKYKKLKQEDQKYQVQEINRQTNVQEINSKNKKYEKCTKEYQFKSKERKNQISQLKAIYDSKYVNQSHVQLQSQQTQIKNKQYSFQNYKERENKFKNYSKKGYQYFESINFSEIYKQLIKDIKSQAERYINHNQEYEIISGSQIQINLHDLFYDKGYEDVLKSELVRFLPFKGIKSYTDLEIHQAFYMKGNGQSYKQPFHLDYQKILLQNHQKTLNILMNISDKSIEGTFFYNIMQNYDYSKTHNRSAVYNFAKQFFWNFDKCINFDQRRCPVDSLCIVNLQKEHGGPFRDINEHILFITIGIKQTKNKVKYNSSFLLHPLSIIFDYHHLLEKSDSEEVRLQYQKIKQIAEYEKMDIFSNFILNQEIIKQDYPQSDSIQSQILQDCLDFGKKYTKYQEDQYDEFNELQSLKDDLEYLPPNKIHKRKKKKQSLQ